MKICIVDETMQTLDIASVTFNRSDGIDNCNPPRKPTTPAAHTATKTYPSEYYNSLT